MTSELIPRRGMIAALLKGFGGGAVTLAAIEGDDRDDDVALLIRTLDECGEEIVARVISEMIDISEVKRRSRAAARKERRQVARRQRRERHDDEVLYRGPCRLDSRCDEVLRQGLRTGRGGVTKHRIQVGDVATDLALWRDDAPDREDIIRIPAGTRMIIDLRRPLGHMPCCEITRRGNGQLAVHLHSRQQPWDREPQYWLLLDEHVDLRKPMPVDDGDDLLEIQERLTR